MTIPTALKELRNTLRLRQGDATPPDLLVMSLDDITEWIAANYTGKTLGM